VSNTTYLFATRETDEYGTREGTVEACSEACAAEFCRQWGMELIGEIAEEEQPLGCCQCDLAWTEPDLSNYQVGCLRAAVRARDERYSGIGGFSTGGTTIDLFKRHGLIVYTPRGYVATESGAKLLAELEG